MTPYYLNNSNKITPPWWRFVYTDFNLKNGLFATVCYTVYTDPTVADIAVTQFDLIVVNGK